MAISLEIQHNMTNKYNENFTKDSNDNKEIKRFSWLSNDFKWFLLLKMNSSTSKSLGVKSKYKLNEYKCYRLNCENFEGQVQGHLKDFKDSKL